VARASRDLEDVLTPEAQVARVWERPSVNDSAELVGQLPVFSRLGKRQLRQIAKLAEFAEFAPGDVVIQAGEPGDSLYLILDGRARVIGKGRARRLGPGDFFGEMALLDGEPRSATITATSELHAMKLRRGPFTKVLAKEPRLALPIMEALATRVRRLEKAAAA
jgi:CRP/FNR family transcriptional regulator, cyclic AMP receptor protein